MVTPTAASPGRKPGPKSRGPQRRFVVYLTLGEEALLRSICDSEECSQAEAIRQALKRWKD